MNLSTLVPLTGGYVLGPAATRVQDKMTQPDSSAEPAAPAAPRVGL